MKTLADITKLFDDYRAAPTTMNGHKILQMIKAGDLQKVLYSVQWDLEEAEHNKIFNPTANVNEKLDKYQKILQIVMEDCQPMAS